MQYAEVAVNASWGPRQTFTYSVPSHLAVQPGQAVWVPFGPRPAQGIVFALAQTSPVPQTRDITGLIDTTPLLSPTQVALAQWISLYYLAPPFDCAALMAPPGFERRLLTIYHPFPQAPEVEETSLSEEAAQVLRLLRERGSCEKSDLEKVFPRQRVVSLLGQLEREGLVTKEWRWDRPRAGPKEVTVVHLTVDTEEARRRADDLKANRHQVQARVLEVLLAHGGLLEQPRLREEAGATGEHLDALVQQGFLRRETLRVERDPLRGYLVPDLPRHVLTPSQQRAWLEIAAALDRGQHSAFLLHGVTASGKTELYLRALERVVTRGKRGIVLVPEISLTPQMLERFVSRFPGRVALLHSGLSPGEQFDEWWRIKAGAFDVVIGPRSAIFSPQPDLGLVVVDEEHEWSYKQVNPAPRYHAREVARKLAELTGAVLLLGSATPDVETYYRAQQGAYQLLELPERVPASAPLSGEPSPLSLPEVQVVDLRQELREGNRSMFSRALQQAMGEALAHGEQVILFLNRRGTATFVQCRDCGSVLRCSSCEVALTYHAERDALVCHQCNRKRRVAQQCPRCTSRRIKFLGLGTQKVEEEVGRLFPTTRVLRWDRDVTQARGAHERLLHEFAQGRANVLVGTQMIAKGLHLPQVTLVGVINADIGLHLPDFRAGERTFQVLCQVAGRAGRGERAGRVIVQTYSPEHYAVRAAAQQDYPAFYREEVENRRRLQQPPFVRLVRLLWAHTNEVYGYRESMRVATELKQEVVRRGLADTQVLGPAPAYPPRVKGRFRWHVVLRGPEPAALLEGVSLPAGWSVDVDPISVL